MEYLPEGRRPVPGVPERLREGLDVGVVVAEAAVAALVDAGGVRTSEIILNVFNRLLKFQSFLFRSG